jgi:hypothetical protein
LDALQFGNTRDDATGDATDDAQRVEPRGQAATKASVEERKQKLQALAEDLQALQAKMTAVEGIAKASARAGLSQLAAAEPRIPGVNFFPSAGTAHALQAHDVLPHAVQAHHVQGRQNIPGVKGKSKAARGSNREKQGSGNEEVDDVSEQDDDVSVRDPRPMPMIKNADQQLRGGAAGRVQAGYWSRS